MTNTSVSKNRQPGHSEHHSHQTPDQPLSVGQPSKTSFSEALSPWGARRAESVSLSALTAPIDSQITLPGSKSYTNRALVIAAFASGASTLKSPLFGDDSYWCMQALRAVGLDIEADREKNHINLKGLAAGQTVREKDSQIYIGSAGTVARFLPGMMAARASGTVRLVSSEQMAKRPIDDLVRALRDLGAHITTPEGRSFPMDIEGGSLKGGKTTIAGHVSSQFLSGLLLCAPLARNAVEITLKGALVQPDYVKITLDVMAAFGVSVTVDADFKHFRIEPQSYKGCLYDVEADASTATYFLALAAVAKGRILITNLNPNSLQPDIKFAESLEKMGCRIERKQTDDQTEGQTEAQPHGLLIDARDASLRGAFDFDFSDNSDSTPALVAVAPFADGPISVRGVAHIRTHECDRLAVLAAGLKEIGIPYVEHHDGLDIEPLAANRHKRIVFNPMDDHRMAMSMAVLMLAGAGGEILDPACVSKTCPQFFDILAQDIGITLEYR